MNEIKSYDGVSREEKNIAQMEDTAMDEKAQIAHNKAAAVEAENAEHAMGVPEALKAYPMAATWAFIMSCTIVSRPLSILSISFDEGLQLTLCSDHGGLLCLPNG